MKPISLCNGINQALIVAYKENIHPLESFLTEQGFICKTVRQSHRPEYKSFSRSYLCLLNHCEAWKIASSANQPTLIVEADFVPVKAFRDLPIPFPAQSDVAMAWLYTCAPQIYSVTPSGYAVGYSTSMVAYIVTPLAARHLQELAQQIANNPGPTQYSPWDSSIESFMRQRGFECYVPWRNYGEHGGKPNSEHKEAGLSAAHRADVLYGPLAFEPIYAATLETPRINLPFVRLKARAKGIARLLLGKYVRWKVLNESSTPFRIFKFAAGRHLTLRL